MTRSFTVVANRSRQQHPLGKLQPNRWEMNPSGTYSCLSSCLVMLVQQPYNKVLDWRIFSRWLIVCDQFEDLDACCNDETGQHQAS